MDNKKFKVRQPEPAQLFIEFGEVAKEDVLEYIESCKIAKHVISMFTNDTISIQETRSRISNVIEKWRNNDTCLEKMCDDLIKISLDMREVCNKDRMETSGCISEIKKLRESYTKDASEMLQILISDATYAYIRIKITKSTLHECHIEKTCPICMTEELVFLWSRAGMPFVQHVLKVS
jgi:hypothetical protein